MCNLRKVHTNFWRAFSSLDGLGALALRLYLASVFVQSGYEKYLSMPDVIAWVSNKEFGLGLPFAPYIAWLIIGVELIGALLLIPGIFVRLTSCLYIGYLAIVALKINFANGWLYIANANNWLANHTVMESSKQLDSLLEIVEKVDKLSTVLPYNDIVIVNNGLEMITAYIIMFFCLLFFGAGRFTSFDHIFSYKN